MAGDPGYDVDEGIKGVATMEVFVGFGSEI